MTYFLNRARKIFLLVGISISFLSCVTNQPGDPPQVKKEVRDVSLQARREDSAPRKRLMVLPFLDTSEVRPQEFRDKIRSEFIRDMNKKGELIVVDSRDLNLDLKQHMKSGEYILADVGKAASDLGVSAVLEGKIVELKVSRKADPVGIFRQIVTKLEASVRVRLAWARNGKEIFNTIKTVSLEESQTRVAENASADKLLTTNPELLEKLVADAFNDFEPQIFSSLAKLSWEGRIAAINGDRIFVNVGRISGLQVGDILRVTEEGDDVFDPQTGNFIGRSPGRQKGTLEVVSYFGQDGAIAVIHSGAGFKENDRVEQY